MSLTDSKCKTARPHERAYKLADGLGLYLLVKTNGARLWRLDYRFDGKRRTMALGGYPQTSLLEARESREGARKLLRAGSDPMQQRFVDRHVARATRATTFGLVADELLSKLAREAKAEATLAKRRWLLKDLAAPLANRPVASITAPEVLGVLREVELSGRLETAKRLVLR